MNINYKITTWILLIIAIVSICFNINNQTESRTMNMHQMPNGTMMHSDSSMSSMMMDMTGRMKGKTGDELDKIFLEDMIVHHQGAVDMAKELQKSTKRPELQKMAKDIIDAQTKEIDMMKTWLAEWFK